MNPLVFTGAAPLPIPPEEAVAHARYLRERYRFRYSDIEKIMGLYHGQFFSADTWRKRLRTAGVPGKRHGVGGCC